MAETNSLGSLYTKKFKGEIYANNIGSRAYADRSELRWVAEEFYHEVFTSGDVKGDSLLDVGCGPLISGAISASAIVPNIYLGDFVDGNIELIKKWVSNEPEAPDFTPQLQFVATLEEQKDFKYLENRVRKSIKEVIQLDILADKPLGNDQKFDIVVSSLCLDCFADDDEYNKGMKNISNMIKNDGWLCLVATIECNKYRVGEQDFPAAWLDEKKLKRALKKWNFEINIFKEKRFTESLPEGYDNKGFFLVLATKKII